VLLVGAYRGRHRGGREGPLVRAAYLEKKLLGGEHGLRGLARGRVREGDVPPPARSAQLKLPPFYEVNGNFKLKRGPLQHCKNT
jgi:hypothetical protein